MKRRAPPPRPSRNHIEICEHFLTAGIETRGQSRAERAAARFAYLNAAGFRGNINVENAGYVEGPGADAAIDWLNEVIFKMPRSSKEQSIRFLLDSLAGRRVENSQSSEVATS